MTDERPAAADEARTRRGRRGLAAIAGLGIVGVGLVTAWALDRAVIGDRAFEPAAAAAIAGWGLLIVVATLRGHVGARIALGALGLAAPPMVWLYERTGWHAGPLGGERGPVALALAGGCVLALVGLVGRRIWAWWLAAAGAALGLATGVLNLIGSLGDPGLRTWSTAVVAGFSTIALAGLIAPDVRRAFDDDPRAAIWRAGDPVIAALRVMIVADLVALPTLLIYAWQQPVIEATATPALALAGLLGVAVVLTVRKRVIGALLLALVGAALGLLAAYNLAAASSRAGDVLAITGYYACFWIPAGLLSLRAGLRILGRLGRLGQLDPTHGRASDRADAERDGR